MYIAVLQAEVFPANCVVFVYSTPRSYLLDVTQKAFQCRYLIVTWAQVYKLILVFVWPDGHLDLDGFRNRALRYEKLANIRVPSLNIEKLDEICMYLREVVYRVFHFINYCRISTPAAEMLTT